MRIYQENQTVSYMIAAASTADGDPYLTYISAVAETSGSCVRL